MCTFTLRRVLKLCGMCRRGDTGIAPLQAGLVHHDEEKGGHEKDLIDGGAESKDEEFAIVFAAMGVNMETAHFFKQVRRGTGNPPSARHRFCSRCGPTSLSEWRISTDGR